jgi:hypothetical protein
MCSLSSLLHILHLHFSNLLSSSNLGHLLLDSRSLGLGDTILDCGHLLRGLLFLDDILDDCVLLLLLCRMDNGLGLCWSKRQNWGACLTYGYIYPPATPTSLPHQPPITATPTSLPHPHHCHTHITATPTSPPHPHHCHTHITATPISPPHPHHCHTHITATPTSLPHPHHRHTHITATPTSLPHPHHCHTHITATPTSLADAVCCSLMGWWCVLVSH